MGRFTAIILLFVSNTLMFNVWAAPFLPSPLSNFFLPEKPVMHESGGEEYIVIFGADAPHASDVLKRINLTTDHVDVGHVFDNSAFRGFSAHIQSHCIDALGKMEDMLHVERAVMARSHSASTKTVRPYSPWGLQRISSSSSTFGDPKAMSYSYTYAANSTLGSGVDIYVVDTGINTANNIFSGRARMAFSFEPDFADNDGHGTHVSGTAGGYLFGVASGANLIGVKVLGADGTGSTSDTIAGMDYVINAHDARRAQGAAFTGSIMSMSWGLTSVSGAIQTAVSAALDHGIHVSMAAGNSAADACNYSPSAAGGARSAAVSVGSIGPSTDISSFSNTGSCVDMYAPGEDVLSAWIGGDNVVNYLSGTSMACPHVTGTMAYLMAADQSGTLGASPRALKDKLLEMTLKGVVQGNTVDGDGKRLLNNGMVGSIGDGVTLGKITGRSVEVQGHVSKEQTKKKRTSIEETLAATLWKRKMRLAHNGETNLRY